MINKICEVCGKVYFVKNYRKEKTRFCSKKCQGKWLADNILSKIDKSYLMGNKFREGKIPTNHFEKGHIPWNNNLKGLHLSKETEFKKGQKPKTYKPVGSISQRNMKDGKVRNFIKVEEPNKWELYAVFLVKQAGIKIPKGNVVHHINKNCLDDRIDNLEVLTRSEHINLHRKDLYCKVANDRLNKVDAGGQTCMFLR